MTPPNRPMTALQQLEAFNVEIANAANGNSRAYDALLASRADEARKLIAAARIGGTSADRYSGAGGYHYINGIEARLPRQK